MIEQRLMSDEEKTRIRLKACDLYNAGKRDEARVLNRMVPMEPFAAQFIKKYVGLDALLAMDVNLAEVEQAYGKEWLTH